MWIIDRYLLRQFLHTLAICFISLAGLYVIFDAFTNLEAFLRLAEKKGGLAAAMLPYYACRSVLFFDRTAGLLVLMAAMFTATWLQRHNELTALMAAGISRVRIIRPVIAASVAIIVLAAINRELVMPRFPTEMARPPKELSEDRRQQFAPRFDGHEVRIWGEVLVPNARRIELPRIALPPALQKHGREIAGKAAIHQPADGPRPAGYLISGVEQPKDLGDRPSLLGAEGEPILITPRDAAWLKPQECFLVSDLAFEELADDQSAREFDSTATLVRYLRVSKTYAGNLRVAVHARIVQPLLDVTLLLLGLPLVFSQRSRNVFAALGLCGAVVTAFMLVQQAFHWLGATRVIPPALAAWAPLAIFAPLAVEMVQRIRK